MTKQIQVRDDLYLFLAERRDSLLLTKPKASFSDAIQSLIDEIDQKKRMISKILTGE